MASPPSPAVPSPPASTSGPCARSSAAASCSSRSAGSPVAAAASSPLTAGSARATEGESFRAPRPGSRRSSHARSQGSLPGLSRSRTSAFAPVSEWFASQCHQPPGLSESCRAKPTGLTKVSIRSAPTLRSASGRPTSKCASSALPKSSEFALRSAAWPKGSSSGKRSMASAALASAISADNDPVVRPESQALRRPSTRARASAAAISSSESSQEIGLNAPPSRSIGVRKRFGW